MFAQRHPQSELGGQPGGHFPGAVAVVTGHACPSPLFRSGLLRKRFPESRQIIDRKVRFPSDDLSSFLTSAIDGGREV